MSVLLTRRAVVQAALEAEYGAGALLTLDDGILVSEPMYTVDPSVLQRDFTRDSLSTTPHIMGRKLASMTFTTELRGNGKQQSGQLIDAPIIARLFQMCGYDITASPTPSFIGPFEVGEHANQVAFTADVSAADNEVAVAYYIKVTTPGASGVAKVTITSDTTSENPDTPVAATGQITFSAQPDEDSTVTINGEVFTFVAAAPGPNEVLIGANLAATLTNLRTALNASIDTDLSVATYTSDATHLIVTYDTPGTAGNAFTLSAQVASNGTVSAGTLAGGTSTEVILTDGAELDVGTMGLTLTPEFGGSLDVGQEWIVWLMPPGLLLKPISDDFTSGALVMYKDGVKHSMPGGFGTFEITATAGEFSSIAWTFTGLYVKPVDEAMPKPKYERTLPSMVELARLRLAGFYAIVETFTFNQANDVQVRPDVSSADGYIGTRIVARAPEGGINPEADKVANNDFWDDLATAKRMPFQMRVGHKPGNTVWIIAPGVQYTGLTYTDRNGILSYDGGLAFPAYDSDDEVHFFLC